MSEQETASVQQSPEGHTSWSSYWKTQNMPWRTEPEIVDERQQYLQERRAIIPDPEKRIYPFKDIKLSRADVEWLLATHDSGGVLGPVFWEIEEEQPDELRRQELDLRGSLLDEVDLSRLPLAFIRTGHEYESDRRASDDERVGATANLMKAKLSYAHLESANLRYCNLEGADLDHAFLVEADLFQATLDDAILMSAHLERSDFQAASLIDANLEEAHPEGTYLCTYGMQTHAVLTSLEPILRGLVLVNRTSQADLLPMRSLIARRVWMR